MGIANTLTKTVLNLLHIEKEPEVKAIDPIIFRNNCQILGEGCISILEWAKYVLMCSISQRMSKLSFQLTLSGWGPLMFKIEQWNKLQKAANINKICRVSFSEMVIKTSEKNSMWTSRKTCFSFFFSMWLAQF